MCQILIHSFSSTNWYKEIRNGGVSTDCSGGSDDHKIVFGLKCTTFGCEKRTTFASRIATTVPLNITKFSSSSKPIPSNQSNATVFTPPELNIYTTYVASMGDLTTSTEEVVMSTIFHSPSPTGVSSASASVPGSSTSSIQVASIMSTTGVSSASTSVPESSTSSIQVASIMSTTGASSAISASTSVRGSCSIQLISTPTAPATSSVDSSLAEELEFAISNVSSIVSKLYVFHCYPTLIR